MKILDCIYRWLDKDEEAVIIRDRKIANLLNENESLKMQIEELESKNDAWEDGFNILLEKYNNFDGVAEIDKLKFENLAREEEYRHMLSDYLEDFASVYNRGFHEGRFCVYSEMGLVEDVLPEIEPVEDDVEIVIGDELFDD